MDFKSAFSDGYTQSRRDDSDGYFQETLTAGLEAAGKDLMDKGLAFQSARMATFWRQTQPESNELRRYIPWDEQEFELARRSTGYI